MILENITMADFKKHLEKTKTIVFPFGTVEEHGRHLPLGTDTLIVYEVLKRATGKRDIFLAPPLYYGVCTTTYQHPGTISISAETLRRLTSDLVIDAYRKGLRNFILISGHGGGIHMSALREAAEILVQELEGIKMAVVSPYYILNKELAGLAETPGDLHAGEIETSIILAIAPGLVKGTSPEEYPVQTSPFVVKDKLRCWPGGVWGNPAKASREKGEKAIQLIADKITEIIDTMEMEKEP